MSRKTLFILLLVVLGGFTILLMLTKVNILMKYLIQLGFQVGRKRAEHDPFLDPMNNPNIHNADINVDPIDDA